MYPTLHESARFSRGMTLNNFNLNFVSKFPLKFGKFKVLKIFTQKQLVKIDHIFDNSFENCTIYCNDTLCLFE
jgi:hypothetical protein